LIAAGFWQPKLAAKIAGADAFLLLIGSKGIAPGRKSNTSLHSIAM